MYACVLRLSCLGACWTKDDSSRSDWPRCNFEGFLGIANSSLLDFVALVLVVVAVVVVMVTGTGGEGLKNPSSKASLYQAVVRAIPSSKVTLG